VVGLGNPGPRYASTRHNAGRLVVEELARRLGVARFGNRFAGLYAEARGPAGPVALLVPTTFMNASGDAVGPAAGSLRLTPARIAVVHDEIDLPFGTVRAKSGGGHGGHNGLRSVIRGVGGPDFVRVRVGIGRPPADFRGDGAAWVLGRFAEPPGEVAALIARAADMIESILSDGVDAAIARFHARPPGERARGRAERRDGALDRPQEGPEGGLRGEPGPGGSPPGPGAPA
jgi:peptidyl-tRNA hydrolase, PTH1 family